MNAPLVLAATTALWVGATLLLSRVRWFRLPPLVERLSPYSPGSATRRRSGTFSADSMYEVLGPLATTVGERVSRLIGIDDDLAARLRRAGSTLDSSGFRLRQVAWSGAALLGATATTLVVPLPTPLAIGVALGAPVLAFLVIEQRVTTASANWQQRTLHELPVVIEQLGMLLSSGYSLGGAIHRLGTRGGGNCARELAVVAARMRQGVGELAALREWAGRADVVAVERLVGVLALNWEANDLGDLISGEARAVRREVHRAEIELIERRAQQVWVPVTVATLVPGVIFMAVPFVDAMGKLTGRG